MDPKYIVAIVAASIFFILFLSFLIAYAVRIRNERKFRESLERMYLNSNLAKMEYDFAVYDEETAKILAGIDASPVKQVTIEDVLNDGKSVQPEEVFAKMDSGELEEITGKYKPE